MGTYVTSTNMLPLMPGLPQTTTSNGYTQTVDLIDKHITRAEDFVNGKIAIRYTVPFGSTSVPPIIRTITQDIASFYSFRSLYSSDNQNYSDYLDSYKEAVAELNEIRDGTIDLVQTDGSLTDTRTSTSDIDMSSNVENKQPFFDIDDADSWNFNSDLEDTISGKR